ncbi:MAG: protein-L-isoaspartate O-methyltransferase [Candidatus Altiarchaeota archaeon]|nr:protein-L-isoaspartate O-methyltransferase [Candidatus Altiarchaeota archaeon]
MSRQKEALIRSLRSSGYLRTEAVAGAFRKVPRECFVPEGMVDDAYKDRPLSIGFGQTISAPHMVAIMTELLDVKEDSRILEVGCGSGYQAAILAEIAGKHAPYDRIIVTAGSPKIPEKLVSQLAEGGVMLVPAGGRYFQDLIMVRRRDGGISTEDHGGCMFVPLIGADGW